MLDRDTSVDLAAPGRAKIVPFGAELAEIPNRIGSRGDRLRFDRFDLGIQDRTHLLRDDAAKVLLEIELVDDIEKAPVVEKDQQFAAVFRTAVREWLVARDFEPTPGDRRSAVRVRHLESGILELVPFGRHPGARVSQGFETSAVVASRIGGRIATDPDPVEIAAGVENHRRLETGLGTQSLGERPSLLLVLERGQLKSIETVADDVGRGSNRRPGLEHELDLAAPRDRICWHDEALDIGREPDANVQRWRGLGGDPHCEGDPHQHDREASHQRSIRC